MITAIHTSLARKREMLKQDEKGFTLVELLVVILIIGILAAIAIPIFLGQQQQANESAAKANLANAKIAVTALTVKNDGTVPTAADVDELKDYGWPQDGSVEFGTAPSGEDFCLQTADPAFHLLASASEVAEGACS